MGRDCKDVDDYISNSASKFETVILNEITHIVKAAERHDEKLDQLQDKILIRREKMNEHWNNLFSRLSILETKTKITSAMVAVIVAGLISIAFGTLTVAYQTTASDQIISTETIQSTVQDNTGVK